MPKGHAYSAKKFKWAANGSKGQKANIVQSMLLVCAQPPTLTSHNFCTTFPNKLQHVLLDSLGSLFLNGSGCKAFGAAV